MASSKRLQKELGDFTTKDPLPWAKVSIDGDNIYKWKAIVEGPEGTPYEGGKFKVDIEIPTEYPFKPPKVQFTTKIYHPNVKSDGSLCTQTLAEGWSPQLKITDVLQILRTLMTDPAPEHALEVEIANVFKNDYNKFTNTAKEWTKKYAK
eukprot:TRINITY_DN17_c1_g1_i1.p2 TRINITY_DN17_c1_g1~~TRINITY_DN17_c1_g1_i1.p2  ORF type:complete len:158 (-),score=81.94 TRINITY_DN17_c1_g1_i1:141-590(-)